MLTIPAAGAGWTVKVLDFGLASRSPTRNQIAGTLAYMAPELLLGRRASVASDLYAVAMVAAEILLGVHPFGDKQRDEDLLEKILNVSPDLSGISSPKLAQVLARALDKAPAKRPADAETFMRELAEAAQVPLPPEPAAVRESYLVAAPFTGREVELGRLIGALNRARFGQGSGWLLLGESGVGKSRLIEELRSLALIAGVVVARGQAISEGATAYQIWQQVLQVLVLHTELSDQEAAVLGMIVPGLEVLLDRPVAVKFIGNVAPDAEDRDRFLVEARAVARIQHPNVMVIYRVGELEGHPFLITEYIRGKSLSELTVPLPWRKVLELGIGLARGGVRGMRVAQQDQFVHVTPVSGCRCE